MKDLYFLTDEEQKLENSFLEFISMSNDFIKVQKSINSNDTENNALLEQELISILNKNGFLEKDLGRFGQYVTWRSTEGAFLSLEFEEEYNPNYHKTFLEFESTI